MAVDRRSGGGGAAARTLVAAATTVVLGLTAACGSPQATPSGSSGATSRPAAPVNPTGAPVLLAIRKSATIVDDGTPAGSITVESVASSAAPTPGGKAPEYGYFVTFTVTVRDLGASRLVVSQDDFWAQGSDGARRTPTSGNAAAAAGPGALGTADLEPGGTVTGTVTVDAASTHGWVVYAPGGTPLDSWWF